jgi:hypothetical protein
MQSFSGTELTNRMVCPECGGRLDPVSLPEHHLLPADTTIIHRSFTAPDGTVFSVALVIGGHERRSIHKPQVCIVAQGNVINAQKLIKVPLERERNLDVMLLDVNRSKIYFAYWFTDGKHETARHLTRLALTAWDGVVRNKRRRWAYISVTVSGGRRHAKLAELKKFIAALHNEISVKSTAESE